MTLLGNENIIKFRFVFFMKVLDFLKFQFLHSPSPTVQHRNGLSDRKREGRGTVSVWWQKNKISQFYHMKPIEICCPFCSLDLKINKWQRKYNSIVSRHFALLLQLLSIFFSCLLFSPFYYVLFSFWSCLI